MTFLANLLNRPQPLADPEAFAGFYERTHLSVFRYLMALRGDAAEAEDITAEAYLRAWKSRHSFQGSPEAALGWILTIARRRLVDQYRSNSARPVQAELSEELADEAQDAEAIFVDQEQIEQVLAALRSLPEQPREIVVLRYVLGWRVNEIAAHLDMPENNVSASLGRAVRRIQRSLESQGVIHG